MSTATPQRKSEVKMFEHLYRKFVTNIKAYGIDEFVFTPSLGGVDFSVGQFGYTVFEFGNERIYISVDGISKIVPPRPGIKELTVPGRIQKRFIGAILLSITFDGTRYRIEFDGMDPLFGWYEPNEGYTDRSYFEVEFPWV